MSVTATSEHAKYCFSVLEKELFGKSSCPIEANFENHNCPVFVTWKKKEAGNEYNLRGCIGTFSNLKLHTGLKKYSLFAAFEDNRFRAITKGEFRKLQVSVSILHSFEKGNDARDWVVGKHGIDIEFNDEKRKRSATYLPHVATQQNWDINDTLKHLIRKTGARGSLDSLIEKISLKRYQCSKIAMTCDEYIEQCKN